MGLQGKLQDIYEYYPSSLVIGEQLKIRSGALGTLYGALPGLHATKSATLLETATRPTALKFPIAFHSSSASAHIAAVVKTPLRLSLENPCEVF